MTFLANYLELCLRFARYIIYFVLALSIGVLILSGPYVIEKLVAALVLLCGIQVLRKRVRP